MVFPSLQEDWLQGRGAWRPSLGQTGKSFLLLKLCLDVGEDSGQSWRPLNHAGQSPVIPSEPLEPLHPSSHHDVKMAY